MHRRQGSPEEVSLAQNGLDKMLPYAAFGSPLTVPCGWVWSNEQEEVGESARSENRKDEDEEFGLDVAVDAVEGGAGLEMDEP